MSNEHKPVLCKELIQALEDVELSTFLDGTFGRGGHTREILKNFPKCKVFACDKDIAAVESAKSMIPEECQDRFFIFHGGFEKVKQWQSELCKLTGVEFFSAILLDLGVSSPQLDTPERGFSFYAEGPLDMRMDQNQELTAATIVNEWAERDLIQLFQEKGEIRKSESVVKEILRFRGQKKITTTRELAKLIENTEAWGRRGHHPATRFFLALRLEVNQELEVLEEVIEELIRALEPGGRLCIMTFHSLEDRIVKLAFRRLKSLGKIITKKVIRSSFQERKGNPRARSAQLRVFQALCAE